MEKKRYERPEVKRVRLDIKTSVLGFCQQTPDYIISPTCEAPGTACPSSPSGSF